MTKTLAGGAAKPFMVTGSQIDGSGLVARGTKAAGFRQGVAGIEFTMARETGTVAERQSSLPDAKYRLVRLSVDRTMGNSTVSVAISRLDESRTVLGARLGDLFAKQSRSTFLDAGINTKLAYGWSLAGAYRRGWTAFQSGAFTSDAFALDLKRRGAFSSGDEIAFRFSQPLRATAGGMEMRLPISYDYSSKTAVFGNSRLSFEPSGRELAAEVGYTSGRFGVNTFVRRHPDHVSINRVDVGAAVRFSRRF